MTPSLEVTSAAQSAQRTWKVPASVSIAQYALESAWGRDMPAGSLNPFGIKATGSQAAVKATTHEFFAGRYVTIQAPFRVFASLADAFNAHAELIATAPVYAAAMSALPNLSAFVTAMAKHYATDPTYALKLMTLIRVDGLAQYDAPT